MALKYCTIPLCSSSAANASVTPHLRRRIKSNVTVHSLVFSSTLPHGRGFVSGIDSLELEYTATNPVQDLVFSCDINRLYSCTKSSGINVNLLNKNEHLWSTIIYLHCLRVKVGSSPSC